tara:strand:+ start:312 stop:770 length:459 start_codon:yes stop_codon:yes gene_type:complete
MSVTHDSIANKGYALVARVTNLIAMVSALMSPTTPKTVVRVVHNVTQESSVIQTEEHLFVNPAPQGKSYAMAGVSIPKKMRTTVEAVGFRVKERVAAGYVNAQWAAQPSQLSPLLPKTPTTTHLMHGEIFFTASEAQGISKSGMRTSYLPHG